MKIQENRIVYKQPISFFEALFGSYYGRLKLRVDDVNISRIFDFGYLNGEQVKRLKEFAEKHKSELPVGVVEEINRLNV